MENGSKPQTPVTEPANRTTRMRDIAALIDKGNKEASHARSTPSRPAASQADIDKRRKDNTDTYARERKVADEHQEDPADEEASKMKALAGAGDEDEPAAADADTDDEAQGVSLDEVARTLGVKARDLYDMRISMGDGKVMTLGEIKDLAKTTGTATAELTALRAQEEDRGNEVMRQRHELSVLLASLGGQAPPQVHAAIEEIQARNLASETQALLAVLPAWKDPVAKNADLEKIVDLGKQYGFSMRELSGVTDHRLVKLLRDMAIGRAAAKAAANPVKKPPAGMQPAPHKAATSSGLRAALQRAKAPGASRNDKIAGVAALIS